MALSQENKLAIYRRNLKRYEDEGNEEIARVERRLIKRIEGDDQEPKQ